MNEDLQPLVDRTYEEIIAKIGATSTLYGSLIDIDDPKQVAVAAYYIAMQEVIDRNDEERKMWRMLVEAGK